MINKKWIIISFIVGALLTFGFFQIPSSTLPVDSILTGTTNNTQEEAATTSEDFLSDEEVVIIETEEEDEEEVILPIEPTLFEYVEVTDGCGPYFEGECVNIRSGPGTEFEALHKLRNGMVLKVDGEVERDGRTWYHITFNSEWIRYPERIKGGWYVAADYVRKLLDEGQRDLDGTGDLSDIKKRIVVDQSEQKLYAYEGDNLFMEETISTGLELTPTPRGEFRVFRKTPSRYMQGPIQGLTTQYWDLPGVPWNLYFTKGGAVIHGAYWHNKFGNKWSKGCVNITPSSAEKLYKWADLGTKVIVQN